MEWNDLRVFLALARAGRVSAAAKRLDVEHTTVSRRIAALERALGVPLFFRTRSGYVLTPHGENVLANAERMEAEALAAAARARERTSEPAGRVRLALAPEFASHWLVPKLATFHAKYPRIVLHVLVGTRERDLTRGEADVAIQTPRPHQPGLIAVRIARTATRLYLSRRAAGGATVQIGTVADLGHRSLLAYSSPFGLLQDAKWLQPLLASGQLALETNSTHALLAGALAGAGVAVLPRFVARAYPDLMPVSDLTAETEVWMTTHPEVRRDPKVRVTAEFLKRAAAGAGGLV